MIRKSTHDLALLVANNFAAAGLSEEDERYYLQSKSEVVPAIRRGFTRVQAEPHVEVIESPRPAIPGLISTSPTFADWLKAREAIHQFITGETINLLEMFAVGDGYLARTDIMPVFRPAGATNRMALDWKVKLGMNASWEEDASQGGVDRYKNAEGQNVPHLCCISRSVRPDENTLGKSAKSPDGLMEVKRKSDEMWLNLFGWSTADDLHFLITGEHLDSVDTLTWFPEDRLPGDGEVAYGDWYAGLVQAGFHWRSRGSCSPSIGGRLAKVFSLRKP